MTAEEKSFWQVLVFITTITRACPEESKSNFATKGINLALLYLGTYIWDATASCCPNNPWEMLRCSPTSKGPNYPTWSVTHPQAWENSSGSPHRSAGAVWICRSAARSACSAGHGEQQRCGWGGFVMGMLGRELIALKAISSPFIWSLGDLNGGLLTPPAQSSQQLLSQVPANRSTCLWSQSGPSGDQAPFPRLIGVRRVENVTPLPFLKGLFKAGCKPLILLLLLWVSFSASFPPHTPSQVVLKVNMQSFFLWDAGANPHC